MLSYPSIDECQCLKVKGQRLSGGGTIHPSKKDRDEADDKLHARCSLHKMPPSRRWNLLSVLFLVLPSGGLLFRETVIFRVVLVLLPHILTVPFLMMVLMMVMKDEGPGCPIFYLRTSLLT